MDTQAVLKWVSYIELKSFSVNETQTFKVVAWPVSGKIETPRYGVYIYTKDKL